MSSGYKKQKTRVKEARRAKGAASIPAVQSGARDKTAGLWQRTTKSENAESVRKRGKKQTQTVGKQDGETAKQRV